MLWRVIKRVVNIGGNNEKERKIKKYTKNNMLTTANHLNYQQKINSGSFYTPPELVNHVWKLIAPFRTKNTVILDTSAGKGSFFLDREKDGLLLIAADNDKLAIDYLKENFPQIPIIQKNALINIKRVNYGIQDNQKLIIIGNPPYNDLTSLKARKLKENFPNNLTIDPQIKSRDLGISFLRSYYQLKADYVCVLHPLSYLIKETNFNSLKEFKDNYRLLKSLVVDSKKFSDAKGASFPIAISLYQLDKKGMNYEYIKNFPFQLENGKLFSLNSFQFLTDLVNKYPKKKLLSKGQYKDLTGKSYISDEYLNNLFFFTFRDINSIMRNRTFIQEFNNYSVPIHKDKLKYYAYIDYFKDKFQGTIPFHLRNFDVFYSPDFQEEDWKYFTQRISSKLKNKKPEKLTKTSKIKEFEAWVANL